MPDKNTKLPRGHVLQWQSIEGGRLPEVYMTTRNGLDVYVLKFSSAAECLELANFLRGAAGGLRRARRAASR